MQTKLKKNLFGVTAIVIFLLAIIVFQNYFSEELMIKNIDASAQEKSKTITNNAISSSKEILANSKSDSEKLQNAINIFRGFYLSNAKSRPKYCLKYNVQIDSFVRAFEKEHSKEYAFMKKYEASNEPIPAKSYEKLNELLDKKIATEMNNTTKENNLTIEEYCKTFQTNTNEYIEYMKISKVLPEIYHLLNK